MDERAAVGKLESRLPEFASAISEHAEDNDGEIQFQVLMGDLGRFYMAHKQDADVRTRYWLLLEELASNGSQSVKNAIHVSLVEWFLADPGGPEAEAFLEAQGQQGPTTAEMASHYPPS